MTKVRDLFKKKEKLSYENRQGTNFTEAFWPSINAHSIYIPFALAALVPHAVPVCANSREMHPGPNGCV